jgi:hypothetical protein
MVPPPSAARETWSAKWAKSAERMDGASSIKVQTWVQTNKINELGAQENALEDSSTQWVCNEGVRTEAGDNTSLPNL